MLAFLQWPLLDAADLGALVLYLIMHVIIDIYRIRLQKTTVTLAMSVMIAVLVQYGVLSALILSLFSMAIGAALTQVRLWRIWMINASMITISTISAGIVYTWLDGPVGNQGITKWGIFTAFIFSLVVLVVNHTILLLVQQNQKMRKSFWWVTLEFAWDAGANIASLPLGMLLYQTHLKFLWYGLGLFVMPLIAVSAMFQLYSQTYHENRRLQRLYQTLAAMATEVRVDRFMRLLRKALVDVLEMRRFQVLEWNSERQTLVDLETNEDVDQPRWIQLLINEPATKLYIQRWPDDEEWFSVDAHERERAMVIPLRQPTASGPAISLHGEQPLGTLVVYTMSGEYGPAKSEEELLFTVAQQVTTSIRFIRKLQSRERRSKTDDLTGLSNLRSFQEMLNEQVEISESTMKDLSLILMDIDHFKQVNDVHGHLVGNQILQQIAALLKEIVTQQDWVCRYGGEEFAVILPAHGSEKARFVAEQIRERIEQNDFKISGSISEKPTDVLKITVSVGVATFPTFAKSSVELIRLADRAMYIGAKRAGRNRVSVFGVNPL